MGIELGLGLIGIGRPWGNVDPAVPDETTVLHLLDAAFENGIRYFDTAPSYGCSEHRLGIFLRSLSAAERRQVVVATKFGEHWDSESSQPFVDHSRAALKRSLDESIARLGIPDVLQLHRTTPEALMSDEVASAFEYAGAVGVRSLGASVSDAGSADMVLADPLYTVMQVPFNRENQNFQSAITRAHARGMRVAVNRPFGMGRLLVGAGAGANREALAFVLRTKFQGVILTGTKSVAHLRENVGAFRELATIE
jgi:aryl-alcohol dehydrogenase-like predicted oxidoreductase